MAGFLGFLVLAARWIRFREARVEGVLPVRQRACGLPHGMLAFQLPELSPPGSCFCCDTASHCAN